MSKPRTLTTEQLQQHQVALLDPDKPKYQKELLTVRLQDDGAIYFEFARAVTLEPKGSNCFVVRITE